MHAPSMKIVYGRTTYTWRRARKSYQMEVQIAAVQDGDWGEDCVAAYARTERFVVQWIGPSAYGLTSHHQPRSRSGTSRTSHQAIKEEGHIVMNIPAVWLFLASCGSEGSPKDKDAIRLLRHPKTINHCLCDKPSMVNM